MEALKESLRPRPRPRIQTGKKTLRNRVVWSDETSEDPYSEITYTVPWGEGYAVIPTVDANGNKLSVPEALEKTFDKKLITSSRNPLDFVTGEELPVFSTEEEANRYAQWRSDTMFDAEAIAEGFEIAPTQIFPDAPLPEVDNRSITNKVINKLNRFLAYTGVKSYKGEIEGFDEGGLTDQMEMFGYTAEGVQQEVDKYVPEPSKGLSYPDIILDSILGLENNYETNVEGIVKQFNKDKMGFLETIAKSIYEETEDFVKAPVELPLSDKKLDPTVASVNPTLKAAEFTASIASEITAAVKRLSSQDLSTRLQGMFGVDYNNATDDQVSKARESVLGDALIVGEFIPAVRAVGKAVPSGVKADVIGQTKALLQGDKEFLQGVPTEKSNTVGVGANVPGMFPERVVDPDDVEPLSTSEIEFYEMQDKFLDPYNKKSIKFTDAFTTPALVNRELDTGTNIINSGELSTNLEDVAGGANTQTFIPAFSPNIPDVKNNVLTDEQYTQFINSKDPTLFQDIDALYSNRDDFWFIQDKNPATTYPIEIAEAKSLGDVVKSEYFKKVQGDIKESIELTFKSNIDRLDPTDVFTLVGLLKKRSELNKSISELKNQNIDYGDKIPEFNAVRTGVNNTIKKIVEDLRLTDSIFVSDPRDYLKDAWKKEAPYQVVDLTPREKKINVTTQEPYYETVTGTPTLDGDLKYPFSSVFGVEPKDSGIFYGAPDGQSFSIDIETVIQDHFSNKLNTTETIAGRSFDELSNVYANQYLKNVKSNKKIPTSNLRYVAIDVITDLFEKTNKKVIPGGVIIKALQEDPRVNNKTIPPYFLTEEFKNRVFKTKEADGVNLKDLTILLSNYEGESPVIRYSQSNRNYPSYQRQESEFNGNFMGGEAVDYKESQITATDRDTNLSPFTPILTHYDDGTLAHTRVSTINPNTAPLLGSKKDLELYKSIIGSSPFKLVQEIQSDLVSKGIQKFKKLTVTPDIVKKIFYRHKNDDALMAARVQISRGKSNPLFFPAYNANKDLIEKYDIDNYELNPEKGEKVFKTVAEALEDIANQPDGKDVVMAKEKFDELTRKTVDTQELKYKNLSVPEKFDMLFDVIVEDSELERHPTLKNRILTSDISNEELRKGLQVVYENYDPSNPKKLDRRFFLLAYNDFKRNGTIPNNPDILENAKDVYMDSLRSDYARYLNNFISNTNNIDKSQVNPDGIKNFSAQSRMNQDALENPSTYQDAPIKVKDAKGVEDYVSLIIQKLISDADADGIDKIVFPPVERILERRFSGQNLKYALENKSISNTLEVTDGHPLYKTYGIVLPKVLDKFEKTYGIKIYRDVELPYSKSGRDLSNKGIIIDISNMRKKFDLSRPAFAEGGTIMNDQMEMAFMKQGGIKDDGMNKDPVSGNEIPPGSMATEVRDDIPAMLSEGEYVVPADVLRYYGVNFFENLRGQAKNGLQSMEQNGRIGGTPLSDQDVARNMQQPVMASDGTYMSDFSPATARLNTPMFTGTSSQLANVAAAQDNNPNQETVTVFKKHYNTAGESIQIKYQQMPGGAMQPAPGQDSELAKYPMDEVAYAAYLKGRSSDSSGNGGGGTTVTTPTGSSTDWMKGIDFRSSTEVQEWADKTLKTSKVIKNLGKAGGIFAAGASVAVADKIARVNGAIMFQESLGTEESKALAETLRKQVEEFTNKNESFGLDIINAIGGGTGKRYFNDLLERENKPMDLEEFAATTTRSGEGAKASKNIAEARKGSGMGKSTVTSTGTGANKQYTSGATRVKAGTATADEVKAMKDKIVDSGGTYNVGGRNKGGLMTKGKKKK